MASREGKIRLSDLRERDAVYEYWWRRGHMHDRRLAWVDTRMYASFKRATKENARRSEFLGSG